MDFIKLVLAFVDLEAALLLFFAWREAESRTAKFSGGTLCLLFIVNMILIWP